MNSSSRSVETGIRALTLSTVALVVTTALAIPSAWAASSNQQGQNQRPRALQDVTGAFTSGKTFFGSLKAGFALFPELDCSDAVTAAENPNTPVFKLNTALETISQCLVDVRSIVLAEELKRNPGTNPATVLTTLDTVVEPLQAANEKKQRGTEAGMKFLGYTWGVGFGFSHYLDEVISEAVIVDGVVHATEDRTQEPRVIFEFHKYFGCKDSKSNPTRGCGPFFGVTTGQSNVLAGVGFGFMHGWRSRDEEKGTGFSVGIGALLEGSVTDLAYGFADNQPPPNNETAVRYKTEPRWSAILFFTRTF